MFPTWNPRLNPNSKSSSEEEDAVGSDHRASLVDALSSLSNDRYFLSNPPSPDNEPLGSRRGNQNLNLVGLIDIPSSEENKS
jgi:hypothetical protein